MLLWECKVFLMVIYYMGRNFPLIVIGRIDYTKNNLNKVTRIHLESIPRDMSGLISK